MTLYQVGLVGSAVVDIEVTIKSGRATWSEYTVVNESLSKIRSTKSNDGFTMSEIVSDIPETVCSSPDGITIVALAPETNAGMSGFNSSLPSTVKEDQVAWEAASP